MKVILLPPGAGRDQHKVGVLLDPHVLTFLDAVKLFLLVVLQQ